MRPIDSRVVVVLAGLALLCVPSAAAAATPGAPQNVRLRAVDASTTIVSWDPPSSGAPVHHYLVERFTGSEWATVTTTDTQTRSATDDNVTVADHGFVDGYRVTAVGSDGSQSPTAAQFGVVDTDFVTRGPGACYILQVGSGGIIFNGTCSLMAATDPMPEPYRQQSRATLLPLWATLLQVVARAGGGVS